MKSKNRKKKIERKNGRNERKKMKMKMKMKIEEMFFCKFNLLLLIIHFFVARFQTGKS